MNVEGSYCPWPPRDDPKLLQQQVRAERRRLQLAEQRRVREIVHDGNPLVPSVRKRAAVDGNGRAIRGPTASHATWRDPDDNNPRARTPRLVEGYRRHSVLTRLAKLSSRKSGLLKIEHVRAADRYSLHCELGYLGQSPSPDLSGVRSNNARFGAASHDRQAARYFAKFLAARTAIGDFGLQVLDAVVLLNMDVKHFAERHKPKLDEKLAMGFLIAALTRLVEHYGKRNLTRSVFEEFSA